MNDVGITIMSPREMGELVRGKQHWFFAFGRAHGDYIDLVDQMIGIYPSFPTLLGPVPVTIVPKARLSSERIEAWFKSYDSSFPGIGEDEDIFMIAELEEAPAIVRFFTELRDTPKEGTR